jgi:hypothetical protein
LLVFAGDVGRDTNKLQGWASPGCLLVIPRARQLTEIKGGGVVPSGTTYL